MFEEKVRKFGDCPQILVRGLSPVVRGLSPGNIHGIEDGTF